MALHFSRQELAARRRRACRAMAERGLDGLLVFRQESMYYLTGYDTSGYSMFQGMYLGADGALALCTRSADLRQARSTSVIEDVRIWRDREGANPADDLRDMLESYRCRGKRLGVEYHAYGLTAQRGQMADEALAVANRLTVPGVHVGKIYGEMQNAILAGDGDPSASRWPMGSGQEALLVRYHTGHGNVGRTDPVTFEFAAAYRHYHAALMHVALTGKVDRRHRDMFAACVEALEAAQETLRPGHTVGEVFDAHARTLKKAGYEGHYLNACGYTMGATYPPTWMDWPMVYTGNPQVLGAGMVFFLHMIVLNSRTGLSMCLGETSILTARGSESVTHAPRQLLVN